MLTKMNNVKSFFSSLVKREDGVTAIEYALIAALIALVIIVAVTAVGTSLSATFAYIATKV